MNTGKITGRAKHRQAYGRSSVSRHVKMALERESNKEKKKPAKPPVYDSVRDLLKDKT